jgi:hypothetical protein
VGDTCFPIRLTLVNARHIPSNFQRNDANFLRKMPIFLRKHANF